ncbi:DUF945 family protein [Halomonas urumqiensis]|uniref:DUF945 domain-containing protein n=1 Tax=Halomonas urumqiensis TaxID=1684789 RepID=A0A2N7UC96_9GAMM|nr:DUF945 family protein [Halomonas urumqiensis]PMR78069.1 hypothetical protein C1H70_14910 [Halomonas urumqiensis]PTB03220.1 DUF945 domain-containing protein [Halomonas urumqiensis]GHE20627.1 hypothetical protein GCM10017767_11480 [Halomonas urumqiensis]
MRKERLIVPVVVGLTVIWAAAQLFASLLFERELARALDDLEARGELVVERDEVEPGWLTSTGVIRMSPLLGDAWQLELTYEARHGVLSTRIEGEARPLFGPMQVRLFGDVLSSRPPYWHARYHTIGGTLEGNIQLAPFIASQSIADQGQRELDFQGGRLTFGGEYGDWQLRMQLSPWRLSDGEVALEAGPISLDSRYAYIDDAYHFTQHDLLRIESLGWEQPNLSLQTSELVYDSLMRLDERELRIDGQLEINEVRAAGEVLLTGRVAMGLSRLDADALRVVLDELRELAASGQPDLELSELLALLEPELIEILRDSPRLDVGEVNLQSPMLGLSAEGNGALFFDSRRLDELSLLRLSEPTERQRWRSRLDGDFIWHDVPTVVALWLGLPLDTRELEIDVVRGQVRVNGRPLPPLWR